MMTQNRTTGAPNTVTKARDFNSANATFSPLLNNPKNMPPPQLFRTWQGYINVIGFWSYLQYRALDVFPDF